MLSELRHYSVLGRYARIVAIAVLPRVTVTLVALACGSSGSEPTPPPVTPAPHLTIVSGSGVSDTIDARLQASLVVELRDATDRPTAGASILFVAQMPSDTTRLSQRSLRVASSATSAFGDSVTVTTDASGRAEVALQAGKVAGATQVDVMVVGQSLSASAPFTVLPGAVSGLAFGGLYAVAEVNGTGKFDVKAVDRAGNVAGAPTYSIDTTVATIDGDGTAHARAAVGNFPVTIRAGTIVDNRFSMSVVPVARILVSRLVGAPFNGTIELAFMGLDGNHVQSLVGPETNGVAGLALTYFTAHANRDGTVYYDDVDATGGLKLWVRETSGARHRLTSDALSTRSESWPTPSIDGQWIYFLAGTPSVSATIWQIHPDGSGAEPIGPSNPPGPLAPAYSFLSTDPNGSALNVAVQGSPLGTSSARFNLMTRTIATTLPSSTVGLVYSPVGDKFAYVLLNSAVIVRTVATGREVSFFSQFGHYDISSAPFSPDGKWMVMTNGGVAIMNTETGQIIPCAVGQFTYAGAQWGQ